jgi:hypothetical protein
VTGPSDPLAVSGDVVSLEVLNVGVRSGGVLTHLIDARKTNGVRPTNEFVARVYNHSPTRTLNPGEITARFRIANWGSTYGSATWSTIPRNDGEATSTKSIGPNSLSDIDAILLPWQLTDAEAGQYVGAGTKTHQCMLVELSGTNVTFKNRSVYRNMDFVVASTFTRKVSVEARGDEVGPEEPAEPVVTRPIARGALVRDPQEPRPVRPRRPARSLLVMIEPKNMPIRLLPAPSRQLLVEQELRERTFLKQRAVDTLRDAVVRQSGPGGIMDFVARYRLPIRVTDRANVATAVDLRRLIGSAQRVLAGGSPALLRIIERNGFVDAIDRVRGQAWATARARLLLEAKTGVLNIDDVRGFMPSLTVHMFRDTGRRFRAGGGMRRIYDRLPSFGYFVEHTTPFRGWRYAVQGAQLVPVAPNVFRIDNPPPSLELDTRIEAVE